MQKAANPQAIQQQLDTLTETNQRLEARLNALEELMLNLTGDVDVARAMHLPIPHSLH